MINDNSFQSPIVDSTKTERGRFEDQLMTFYRSTWEYDEGERPDLGIYTLRVYLVQKSCNLCAHFFEQALRTCDEVEKKRLEDLRANSFVTQTGLIMYAEDFAVKFKSGEALPRVRVVDELGLIGRDISDIFFSFERAISQKLIQIEGDVPPREELLALRRELVKCMKIWIFMQSNKKLMIDRDIESTLNLRINDSSTQKRGADKWFPFIQRVTDLITRSPYVENTSYLPTFRIPYAAYSGILPVDTKKWELTSIDWRGQAAEIYQSSLALSGNLIYCRQAIA